MKTIFSLLIFFPLIKYGAFAQCSKEDLGLTYPQNPTAKVWKIHNYIIGYVSEMTIDVDGSPQAYHPQNIGLDNLAYATSKGELSKYVIVYNEERPYIQTALDPFPGYYLSQTSLQDVSKKETDYRRYVNSEEIPFIAIPDNLRANGLQKGDLAYVFNRKTRKGSFAIVADIGSSLHIGEGSVKLAERLGINLSYKKGVKQIIGCDADSGIIYLIFPNSGNQKPMSLYEIESKAQQYNLNEINSLIECLLRG
jgi:Fungal chitosanase of glycosyl hydrolase group 75